MSHLIRRLRLEGGQLCREAADELERLNTLVERIKLEATIHAQEARTANATIAEIYQAVTGATGEPGNWNGAQPVIQRIADLESQLAALQGGTPGATWRTEGKEDPHGNRYDCERAALCMGDHTDDELANEVFLYGNTQRTPAELIAGKMPAIAYLTAAKDRIRWLSRKLEEATHAQPAIAGKVRGALEEARSVMASINKGKQHLVVLADDRAYWQREEWCLWATNEVLPLINEVLAASTSAPIAEQVERDAARYRWLRDISGYEHPFYLSIPFEAKVDTFKPHEVDAAIDAAMLSTQPHNQDAGVSDG